MHGNSEDRLKELFEAARAIRPDTSTVEEYFEARLLTRIQENRSGTSLLSGWAWKLMPAFTALVLMLGVVNLAIEPENSQDVFSNLTNGHEEHVVLSSLTGE